MQKKYITNSPTETKKIAGILARKILKTQSKEHAFVVGLEGGLGAGKTTFLQGFAKNLGIKQKILSPTFVIYKKFKIKNLRFKCFYHFDCYRIQEPEELLRLGFKEIILNPENIVVIEWAEKIRKILPKNVLMLKFKFINEKVRRITLISS